MTARDPFDANHPDNMPAYEANDQRLAAAEQRGHSRERAEWRAVRDDESFYPIEVGFDATTGRLQLPIGFHEWNRERLHPCWPEYLDQMQTVPAESAAPPFSAWLDGVALTHNDGTAWLGPTRPFRCNRFTRLPSGWLRGDPASTELDRPDQQVAHDPTRHLVVRVVGSPTDETLARLAAAGFRPFTTRDGTGATDTTYLIRDRATNGRTGRPPAVAGHGRQL